MSNTGGSVATFTLEDAFPPYLTPRLALIWDEDPWGWISCSLDSGTAAHQYSCNGEIGPGTSEAYVEFLVPTQLTAVQCAAGIDNIAYLTSIAGSEVSIPSNTVQIDYVCSVAPELPTVSPGTCLDGVYTPPEVAWAETPGVSYEAGWGPATRTDGKQTLTVTATKQPASIWAAGEGWTIVGDTATATMDVDAPPCFAVAKTVRIDTPTADLSALPGGILHYGISVTNTGGSVGQFSLQDTFALTLEYITYTGSANLGDSTITCTNASPVASRLVLDCTGVIVPGVTLNPQASLFIDTVTPADCANGIDNTATLTSEAGELDSNTVHVAIDCADVVPALPETTPGSCLNGTYTLPTFTPAETTGISYDYDRSIEDLLANGGDLVITATLQGASSWGDVDTDSWEVDGMTATATIRVDAPPCMTFTKEITSGDGPYAVDDVITYTLVVTNTGTVPLTGLTISDPLVGDLSCETGGSAVSMPVTLSADDALDCEGSHTVSQAEIDAGEPLVNTATASHEGAEPLTAVATALLVVQGPGIGLTKSVDPLVISAPGTVTYTFVLANTGNVTLTSVALVDDLIDLSAVDCDPAAGIQGVPTTLAVNSPVITCTAPYVIDQATFDAGAPIVNIAQVTSDQIDSNEASATVEINPPVVPTEAPTTPTPGVVTMLPSTGQAPAADSGGLVLGLMLVALGLSALAVRSWLAAGRHHLK